MGSLLHLGKKLFGSAWLVGRRARGTCHRINLSEVRLHAGVRPLRSFKARGPLPAVHAGHGVSETGRKAKEALWHGFGRPQHDAEVLEHWSHHAK
jgi:hypothetical protein